VPNNATDVEGSRSLYRVAVTAVVPMTLAEVLRLYREELAATDWEEDKAAGTHTIGKFTLVFNRQEESLVLTLERDEPQTRLAAALRSRGRAERAGMLPEKGKALLVLANASDDKVTIDVGGTAYSLAPGEGGDSPKTAKRVTLEPGSVKLTIKTPNEDAQAETIDAETGTTWALVVTPTGGYLLTQWY